MKLTKQDIMTLKDWGENDEDITQIEEATSKTKFTLHDRVTGISEKIGIRKAIEILGRETFLSGIDRSAFHFTSYREDDTGRYGISFDSSRLFA